MAILFNSNIGGVEGEKVAVLINTSNIKFNKKAKTANQVFCYDIYLKSEYDKGLTDKEGVMVDERLKLKEDYRFTKEWTGEDFDTVMREHNYGSCSEDPTFSGGQEY